MGYPTIGQFDVNIISRTIQNLDAKVQNTYTHLVNSLMGLVILPRQWNLQRRRTITSFESRILESENLNFLNNKDIFTNEDNLNEEIPILELRGKNIQEITFKDIIDNLRHSVAHQSIRPTQENNSWHGIIFRSYRNDEQATHWGNDYRMQLYLTEEQLRILVTEIADKYLAEVDNNDQ
jgi:hypothetical protein